MSFSVQPHALSILYHHYHYSGSQIWTKVVLTVPVPVLFILHYNAPLLVDTDRSLPLLCRPSLLLRNSNLPKS